jgi:outer membrane protein assembly factor BamB
MTKVGVKVILFLLIALLCQSCSGQPKLVSPLSSKNITVWSKNIEQFIAFRGSLYKLDRVFNDGMEYIKGEWSKNGTYIKAINFATKQEVWKNQIQADSITNFVFDDKQIFFGTSLGMYYALDKKTGKELWSYKAPLDIYNFNNIHQKSVIFRDTAEKVYCLNTSDGSLKWTFEPSSLIAGDLSLISGPTYSSGIIFYALNQNVLLGIDADTGLEKWRTDYLFEKEDPFYLQNETILTLKNLNSSDVTVQAFLLKTGQQTWSQKIKRIDDHVTPIIPIFTSKLVTINENFTILHPFEAKTGSRIKNIDLTPYHIESDPTKKYWFQEGRFLYFLGRDELNTQVMLYALNLENGRISWKKPMGQTEKVKIKLAGQYFFLTMKDSLLIINKKNGNEVKNIEIPYEYEISEILKDLVIINPLESGLSPDEFALALRWK